MLDATKQLSINGLSCCVNTPPAPSGDAIHGLPPHCERTSYLVDDYPACPKNWMNGSGIASSYFLSVDPGQHLWLDFNSLWAHPHDVAIVLSVQGINPVTGQKTTALRLEQYREKCPEHGCTFGAERYCKKCKTNWPSQNYLTTTSTPHGLLWIDGWRSDNEKIRGFLITMETMRGVAAQLIGEDRVFAIGIAFFLSKTPKPQPKSRHYINSLGPMYGSVLDDVSPMIGSPGLYKVNTHTSKYNMHSSKHKATLSCDQNASKSALRSRGVSGQRSVNMASCGLPSAQESAADSDSFGFVGHDQSFRDTEIAQTVLEVGAGARIRQELAYLDNHELDYYQDLPAGMIYINYTDQKTCDRILAAGKIPRDNEGFLKSLRVGN